MIFFSNTKIQNKNDICNKHPKNGTIFPKKWNKKNPARRVRAGERGALGAGLGLDVCVIEILFAQCLNVGA